MCPARDSSYGSGRRACCAAAHEHGQELVEFAIALPVLLLLILGIIEFGVLIFDYTTIANAAREGARYGIVHPTQIGGAQDTLLACAPGATILGAACAMTGGLDPDLVKVKIKITSANPGDLDGPRGVVTVQVRYEAPLITAPISQAVGGSVSLSAQAAMRREQ